jgi:hypothetical protein
MGALLDRNLEIARRAGNLEPIAERIRVLLIDGKREQLLSGDDADGRPFAPLAPSTLRHRDGSGAPLVPHGSASRLITMYRVTVSVLANRLEASAGWPGPGRVPGSRQGPMRPDTQGVDIPWLTKSNASSWKWSTRTRLTCSMLR